MAMELTQKQVSDRQPSPMLSEGYGQAPLKAAENLAATAGKVSSMAGDYATDAAVKQKRLDMVADQGLYELKKKEVLRKAAEKVANNRSKDTINAAYDKAKAELESYVRGSTNGNPNIRWESHATNLAIDANTFGEQVEGIKSAEKIKLNNERTAASLELQTTEAVAEGDEEAIARIADEQVEAGLMNPEEGELFKYNKHREIQTARLADQVEKVKSMLPDAASAYADAVKEHIKNPKDKYFSKLTDPERKRAVAELDKAVQAAVKADSYKQKRVAADLRASNKATAQLVFEAAKAGEDPAEAIKGFSNPTGELQTEASSIATRYKDAEAKGLDLDTNWKPDGVPKTEAAFRKMLKHNQDYSDLFTDIHTYKPSGDPDGSKLVDLTIRSKEFGTRGDFLLHQLDEVLSGIDVGSIPVETWKTEMANMAADIKKASEGKWHAGLIPMKDRGTRLPNSLTQADLLSQLSTYAQKRALEGNMDIMEFQKFKQTDPAFAILRNRKVRELSASIWNYYNTGSFIQTDNPLQPSYQ